MFTVSILFVGAKGASHVMNSVTQPYTTVTKNPMGPVSPLEG